MLIILDDMKRKVLVLATSPKTRGGITSVISAHEQTKYWKHWNCYWLTTHIDRSKIQKVFYFIRSIFEFFFRIPFAKMVHIHLSESVSLKRKFIFFKISQFYRKPIIIHFHAFSVETTLEGKNKKLYRYLFRNSDRVVVLSNQWKKWVIKNIEMEQDNIVVIPNPCPVVNYNKIRRQKNILYAGTLNERKGYKDLIKAFSKVANKHFDWKLVFAGNGDIDEAKSIALELGVIDQIEFLGWIKGAEKDQHFSTASIFCLPSYAEGFPMAILDAWAYGIPVITTPVGGIPDVAIPNENMLLFKPGKINELANHLEELIVNEKLRNKLASASKDLSENQFSLRNINNLCNRLYYETLLG